MKDVHGRPHDERQAWDHGIDNWHEQKAKSRAMDRQIGVALTVLGVVLGLGYLAWSGEYRWVNGLLFAVWERMP